VFQKEEPTHDTSSTPEDTGVVEVPVELAEVNILFLCGQ